MIWVRQPLLLFILAIKIHCEAGLIAAEPKSVVPAAISVSVHRSEQWVVAETTNFCCRIQSSETDARDLASNCERLREHLISLWCPQAANGTWVPRCEIVVHPSRLAYSQTLGRLNDASVGSTRLNFDQGRVTVRRIDLRADAAEWNDGALPHELTHVVIAEQFYGRALPRWADEGIAMLSESRAKHQLRMRDLRQTLQSRATYRVREILSVGSLPPAALRDAFYGQSLALTSRLVERTSPREFLAFLQHAEQLGFDQALRTDFQLEGIAGLQADWDRWVALPAQMNVVDLRFPPILLASDVD